MKKIIKLNLSFYLLLLSIVCYGQFGKERIILQTDLPAHGFIGDINGDGNKDLIVAMHGNNKIVWYNNEDGTGEYDTTYQLINTEIDSVTAITGADIDGDGDIDLVSASAYDQKIAWYENIDGQGNFSTQKVIAENIGMATFVECADLDNDGDIDILFSSKGTNYDGQVSWYKNTDGQGNFIQEQTIVTADCYTVATFDINGDGDLDICLSYFNQFSSGTRLAWSENVNGQGNFGSVQNIASGKFISIKAVDMNINGNEDVVAFKDDPSTDRLLWYENIDGLGTFSEHEVNSGSGLYKARTVEAGDFDQDGDIDLISATWGKVGWHKNYTGAGPLGDGTPLNEFVGSNFTTLGYSSAIIGDIDNDGDIDVVGFTGEDTYIHIFRNVNLSDQFQESKFRRVDNFFGNTAILADIDNDNDLDVLCDITKMNTTDKQLAWIENTDGLGNFGTPKVIYPDEPKSYIFELSTAYIDSDDNIDMIWASNNHLFWSKNEGLGNFGDPILIDSFNNAPKLSFEDLDQDGDIDIIVYELNHNFRWYENVDGNFSTINIIDTDMNSIQQMELGDIDGDGDIDLLVKSGWNSSLIHWYENIDGFGNFNSEQTLIDYPKRIEIELGDLDNDGDLDIVACSNEDDKIVLFINNGLGYYAEQEIIVESSLLEDGARSLSLHDLDGDLDLDVLIVNIDDRLSYWYENLNTSFSEGHPISGDWKSQYFSTVTTWDPYNLTSVGDIDNDGKLDIISAAFKNGKISWNRNFTGDAQLEVNCFLDENENGVLDSNEQKLLNQQVILEEQSINQWTNGAGQILYHLEEGDYTLRYTPHPIWTATTDTIAEVSVTDLNQIEKVYFGVTAENPYRQTNAALYSIGATRCGFTVPFVLGYENTGTFINSGYLSLELDSLVTFQSALPTPDSVHENTLYWNYENLHPFGVRGVYIQLGMPGVDFLGEQINMNVESYVYENMDTILSDTSVFESIINCSYDPNDKNVNPDLAGDENYALFGEYLEYTVRFQNTGTDTAINIRIDDYLDPNLDYTTFKTIMTSHPYQVSLDETTGRLSYFFENILLPDSTVNEIASHGFLSYKIKPKSNLPENTLIENTAKIFFDYNPAVITNTTENTLVPIFVSFEKNDINCFDEQNGSIVINDILAVSPYQFLWNDESTNSSINNLEKGDYSLTITDGNNEEHYYDFFINAPEEINSNIESTPEVNGNSNGIASINPTGGTPPYSYLWSTSPTQNSASIGNLSNGLYFVTITDNSSCIKVDSIEVESITGLDNIEIVNLFSIYPNPSNSDVKISVSLNQPFDFTLTINNATGLKIKEYDFKQKLNVLEEIDSKVLPKGVYFIELRIQGTSSIRKLVIL